MLELGGVSAPKAVLFDAGGTLVQLHVERLAAGLTSRGHDPHELDDAFWSTLVLLDDEFGPNAGAWEDWFSTWLDRMADTSRVPRDVMVDAWKEADAQAFLWDQPIEGAVECLTRLRDGGLPVGVVSNADGRISEALARAGLLELLDVVVDSGVVGVAKPDPAIFDHALRPLGVEATDTWYLGDTVRYDAAAADTAGLVSWIVDHKGLHTVDHPRRVADLREFTDIALAATATSGTQRPMKTDAKEDDGMTSQMTRAVPPVEGRKPNMRQRRLWKMHDFSIGRGLEIGPLHNRIMYPEQADVRYVDVFDREQLVKNYAKHVNVKKENIPEIHFPLFDGDRVRTIPEAIGDTGPYDWVLAAHVIEHVPDVIGWLDQIAEVTRDGGKLFLLVPDRRYCFDIHRPGTTVGQMLQEHDLGQTVPSVRAVYDHKRGAVEMDKKAAWRGQPPTYATRKNALPSVMRDVDRSRKGEYVDAHVWTFTSGTLVEQVIELREMGLSEWKVSSFTPTPRDEVEFYVVLERLPRGGNWAPELFIDEPRPAGEMPDWLRQTSAFQRNLDVARKQLKAHEARIAQLEKQLRTTRQQLKRTRASWRWLIGGVVTAPVRALRRLVRRRRPSGA